MKYNPKPKILKPQPKKWSPRGERAEKESLPLRRRTEREIMMRERERGRVLVYNCSTYYEAVREGRGG
jgi:hypothetical protein